MTRTEQSFLEAYESHADAIFRYCLFRVRDQSLAEDLTQETFIKTWSYIANGKDIDSIKAFLYRVARNLIVDNRRRQKPNYSIEERLEHGQEPEGQNAQTIFHEIETNELFSHLKNLSESDRELIILRFVEGYPTRDIAKMLDETPNVISVRIHRAKKTLQTLWAAYA